MVRFLIQFFLSFAFWAFVVWFGLPILKEKAPVTYGRLVDFVADVTFGKRISEAVEIVEKKIGQNVKAASDNLSPVENPEIKERRPPISSPEDPKNEVFTPPNRLTPQNENISVVEDVGEIPQDAIAALNNDPGYPWGIVVTNSFYYDSKMNRMGILAGGTVVERKQSKLEMDGQVAECFYLIDRTWRNETLYLYESDLVMFECTFQAADKTQRDLLVDYCRTKGMLEELRGKAYKEALRKNPYFEQYRNVSEELKTFTQKARQTKEAFDLASDEKRSVLMDQLRRYKAEETGIMQRYKAAKEPYDTWKAQNIGEEKTPRITKTVEIQNLENKLNGMSGAVQELVPGL